MTWRVCFDIACSFYAGKMWLEGPNDARAYFLDFMERGKRFNFWAATVFDDSNRQYTDFIDHNGLFGFLVNADEIITFNGRKYDLVVLEHLVGEQPAKTLWAKPHHDLTGWRNCWKLPDAAENILPDLALRFESTVTERRAELGTPDDVRDRTLNDLASTYRDVMFTYALFTEYLKSGDSDRTFSDLGSLMPKELL
jgi:hypothetical protein